jgi:alpha-glucosidase
MFLNDSQDPNLYPLTTVQQILYGPVFGSSQYNNTPAYRDRDQFFVGRDLLVAPVIQQGQTTRPVYVPSGYNWYDFNGDFTSANTGSSPTTLHGQLNQATPGGQMISWNTSELDLVPAYIREGAIIPVRQLEQYVGQLPKNYLTYNIYPGKDSSYTCYQDDHISMDAETKKAYRTTQIAHQQQGSGQAISITRLEDNYTPPEEFYYVALLGQTKAPSSVSGNSTNLSAVGTVEALTNSAINSYCYSGDQQTIFIKIFDQQSSMKLLVSGLSPIG